jgi:translocator protein
MRRSPAVLLALLVLCLGVGALGGAITATSVTTWYTTLMKPSFNPPDWVFGPVWTTLYVTIAIAGWRVWRTGRLHASRGHRSVTIALWVWGAQLALNLGWSLVFFGARMPGLALAEIILLWIAVAVTISLFWHIDRLAGALLTPYLAWVSFATLLNAAIWWMN